MGFRYPRRQRLSRARDIQAVRLTGKRVKTAHLESRIAPSPLSFVRIGIIVPKYKCTIVDRNQLRRRLRELVRLKLLPVLGPADLWIRPAPSAYHLTFEQLVGEIDRLKEKLLKETRKEMRAPQQESSPREPQ